MPRESGALPLLSYLLDQLYRSDVLDAQGTVLTFATYERLGRLEGAIATRAETVRTAVRPRTVMRSVQCCSRWSRWVPPTVISIAPSPGACHCQRFPRAQPSAGWWTRCWVPMPGCWSATPKGGAPTVRVAHEALITRWNRAREFVQDNAESLKIRRRIEERYALWRGLEETGGETAPRSKGVASLRAKFAAWRARFGHEPGLLSEFDLIDGQRLLREHRSDTEPHLVDYIDRSQADDKRIRSRSVRMLSLVAGVVTVALALLATGAGLIAIRKQHEAESQAQQALMAQSQMLTQAAAGHMQDADYPGALGIVYEVLASRRFGAERSASAINVFQEARAADMRDVVLSGHRHAGPLRRVLAGWTTHRHRVRRPDGAYLGRNHGETAGRVRRPW